MGERALGRPLFLFGVVFGVKGISTFKAEHPKPETRPDPFLFHFSFPRDVSFSLSFVVGLVLAMAVAVTTTTLLAKLRMLGVSSASVTPQCASPFLLRWARGQCRVLSSAAASSSSPPPWRAPNQPQMTKKTSRAETKSETKTAPDEFRGLNGCSALNYI